jgi:hypothetical protein
MSDQDTQTETEQDARQDSEQENGQEDAGSDSGSDSGSQAEGQSATADKKPETGADIEEGEVHGDASRLETDVEQRIDESGSASDDSDTDKADDVDEEQIERERQERLDPENRPKNAEVDNSARDFDIASGQFTDHDKDEEIGPFNDPTAPDGEIEA